MGQVLSGAGQGGYSNGGSGGGYGGYGQRYGNSRVSMGAGRQNIHPRGTYNSTYDPNDPMGLGGAGGAKYDPTGGVNGPNGDWPGYYLGAGGPLPKPPSQPPTPVSADVPFDPNGGMTASNDATKGLYGARKRGPDFY